MPCVVSLRWDTSPLQSRPHRQEKAARSVTRTPPLFGLIAFEEQKVPEEKMMLCHPLPGVPGHAGSACRNGPANG